MAKRKYEDFDDYYFDDERVPPEMRARIDFEVELMGRLIEMREANGLTQAQLAEQSGMKQSAIARLENMKSSPRIETLHKILTPLGYKLAIVPIAHGE